MRTKLTISFLTALLLGPLAALHADDTPKLHAKKPNIVFILIDDMPYAGPSVTGNRFLQTPQMDRIARKGMLFSRACTEPVCGPSRATLITGQFVGRHRHTDNVSGVHSYALMREPLAPLPDGVPADGFAGEAATGARLPVPVQPGGQLTIEISSFSFEPSFRPHCMSLRFSCGVATSRSGRRARRMRFSSRRYATCRATS